MNNSIPKQTGASTFERSDASEVNKLRRSLIRSSLLALGSVRLMAACGGGGGGGASGLSEIHQSRKTPERFLSPGGKSNRTPPPQPVPPSLTTLGPLPSWVPLPGNVSTLTQSNGRLTNTFVSMCAPYYEPFYFRKINDDYSGYVVNPYWGTYGALVGFGGGHSATNDNSVWALELGENSCTFKRLTTPTPNWGDGAGLSGQALTNLKSDNSIRSLNVNYPQSLDSAQWDNVYGEYKLDGQPGAPHSYGALDILGPIDGGAACGTLLTVYGSALTTGSLGPAASVHKVDFANTTSGIGGYSWSRVTNNLGNYYGIVLFTVNVPSQNRVYIDAWLGSVSWFDRDTNTYVTGSGTKNITLRNAGTVVSRSENGSMFHVPERNLLLSIDGTEPNGYMRIQHLDTTQADPTWVLATVGSNIALPPAWSCACWCPDNNRIIVGAVNGDNDAVYEVTIPVNLGSPWPIERAPFVSGTIPWPALNSAERGKNTFKKWSYNPRTKSILYYPYSMYDQLSSDYGDNDVVFVYRPRNT